MCRYNWVMSEFVLTIFEESLATGYVFLSEVLVLLPEDVHIFILKFRCLRTHAN